jgi:hypothetical protein
LRHYATRQKFAGSIPDEVIGFFLWSKSFQPPYGPRGQLSFVTEMSTRNLAGGKGQLVHKAGSLTTICESIVWKMWEPVACYRNNFNFYLTVILYMFFDVIKFYYSTNFMSKFVTVTAPFYMWLS